MDLVLAVIIVCSTVDIDLDININLILFTHLVHIGFVPYTNMHSEDSHVNSINLSSGIGSTTRIPILFPSEYEVWALHFEDYAIVLEDIGYLIWDAITVGTFVHTGTWRVIKTQADYNKLLLEVKDVPQDEKEI